MECLLLVVLLVVRRMGGSHLRWGASRVRRRRWAARHALLMRRLLLRAGRRDFDDVRIPLCVVHHGVPGLGMLLQLHRLLLLIAGARSTHSRASGTRAARGGSHHVDHLRVLLLSRLLLVLLLLLRRQRGHRSILQAVVGEKPALMRLRLLRLHRSIDSGDGDGDGGSCKGSRGPVGDVVSSVRNVGWVATGETSRTTGRRRTPATTYKQPVNETTWVDLAPTKRATTSTLETTLAAKSPRFVSAIKRNGDNPASTS